MSQGAKAVLDAFERLPPAERAEVTLEVLRRVALEPHSAPDESELVQAADQVFLELDRRENQG